MEDYDRREFLSLSLPGFLGVITALPSLCALKALRPTQLIDIFTPPYDKARIEKSRWFEIPPEPLPSHHGIFEAKVS